MTNAFDCSIKSRQLLIAVCGFQSERAREQPALICGHNACLLLFGCVENILNFKREGGTPLILSQVPPWFYWFLRLAFMSFVRFTFANQPATPRLMQLSAHVCARRLRGAEEGGLKRRWGWGRGHLCFFGGHVKFYNFRGA